MSKYSLHQHKEAGESWYKWFNREYNRFNKIKSRKPKKNMQ